MGLDVQPGSPQPIRASLHIGDDLLGASGRGSQRLPEYLPLTAGEKGLHIAVRRNANDHALSEFRVQYPLSGLQGVLLHL
jgi:hypothetical protein